MIAARRARVVSGAVVIVLLMGGVLGVARADRASGLAEAHHVLTDDHRFVNGPHAGAAFADISTLLLSDARSCARKRSADDRRCSARFSMAASTSVAAFALVGCTQPGVYRARRATLTALDAVMTVDRERGAAPPPTVPPVPTC